MLEREKMEIKVNEIKNRQYLLFSNEMVGAEYKTNYEYATLMIKAAGHAGIIEEIDIEELYPYEVLEISSKISDAVSAAVTPPSKN